MKIAPASLKGIRVTVMGLGLHGGGLASANYLSRHGARVTVTDLKDEKALADSLEKLAGASVRLVLGRHEDRDFTDTDLVIKNPGVPRDARHLVLARSRGIPIETDISLFLRSVKNPLVAVTGSKGKSTTASAIHYGLICVFPGARLGGNITVSPLSFLDDLSPSDPVVLELSSWQLADLPEKSILKPAVSMITIILPDHMNHYKSMNAYVADKKIIYAGQDHTDFSIFNADDPYTEEFKKSSPARTLLFSREPLPESVSGGWLFKGEGFIRLDGTVAHILPAVLGLPGEHNRQNLLAAAVALFVMKVPDDLISERLSEFPGIEHRLEFVLEKDGVRFINDSAATIPHAVIEAVRAIKGPVVLITGGTDKNIDFEPFAAVASLPREIILLEGSATAKIAALLGKRKVGFHGPYPALDAALDAAVSLARAGDTVLFSPGCASFGMFQNEFDRGRRFKNYVRALSRHNEVSPETR